MFLLAQRFLQGLDLWLLSDQHVNPLTFLKLFRKCTQPEALENLHDIGVGMAGRTLTDIHSDSPIGFRLFCEAVDWIACLISTVSCKDRSDIPASWVCIFRGVR